MGFVDFLDLRNGAADHPHPDDPPTRPLSALVVGPDDWSVRDATVQLERVGSTVLRCSESADMPFPCRALLPGQGCPLSTGRVDVVVVARLRPGTTITLSEMGVVCAVRAGLPVVSAGPGQELLGPWATQVGPHGDLVETCLEAVRAVR